MPTSPTVGSGGANAPGMDPRKTDSTSVAEITDSFDNDLHQDNRAGQHAGAGEHRAYTAHDVKELHAEMAAFDNAELKRIPILAHGERLAQGGIYLDLRDRASEPFTAQGNMEAQDPHLYVAKADMDYLLWNKLTGVEH